MIAGGKSFVGGPGTSTDGHGTFVAGIIAANASNGVARGMAFSELRSEGRQQYADPARPKTPRSWAANEGRA